MVFVGFCLFVFVFFCFSIVFLWFSQKWLNAQCFFWFFEPKQAKIDECPLPFLVFQRKPFDSRPLPSWKAFSPSPSRPFLPLPKENAV
jgi:hypothetical protein